MIEKVNPCHPDKVADRIAGAIVDAAYKVANNPKIAVEVLLGHGQCTVILESSVDFGWDDISAIVERIAGVNSLNLVRAKQDIHLARNQQIEIKCGDNGIFKGTPFTEEDRIINCIAKEIYARCGCDGKYIYDKNSRTLIICQSNVDTSVVEKDYRELFGKYADKIIVNPLGDWTGGLAVDSGATNRKLGSDMGRAVTGGGLHGKDLSKADVSVNIYAMLKAQETGKEVNIYCAIGDNEIDGKQYSEIVRIARDYIESIGGFEKFAEWGY